MRRLAARVLVLCLFGAPLGASEVSPPPERFEYGAAGEVTLHRPSGAPVGMALFVSGDGGWNQGVVDMAERLRIARLGRQQLRLAPDTPLVLVGFSRGAGLAVVAATHPALREQLAGVVAIALGKEAASGRRRRGGGASTPPPCPRSRDRPTKRAAAGTGGRRRG